MHKLKKVIFFFLCLFLLTSGCISQPEVAEGKLLTIGEENYYSHSILGNSVGYTHYRVTETTQHQNEQVFIVEAETFLSVEMAGTPHKMDYKATEYYTQNLSPRYYKAAITVGEEQFDIECNFEQGKVREKVQSPDLSEEKEIPIQENTYLLDSNTFHHYVFLFRTLNPQQDTEVTVSLFMPQAMQRFDVSITFLK